MASLSIGILVLKRHGSMTECSSSAVLLSLSRPEFDVHEEVWLEDKKERKPSA